MKNNHAAKKVSEKLARIISNSLSVSEIKCYNLAEQADALSFDAIYLWVLKNIFSFSKNDLLKVFNEVTKKSQEYKEYSLTGDFIPPVNELKDFGVDLKELSKEN